MKYKTFADPVKGQEIVDQIYDWFFVENMPFGYDDEKGNCLYKTEESCCAVGVFMDENWYHPNLENMGVDKLFDDLFNREVAPHDSWEDFEHLLHQCQEAHDHAAACTSKGFPAPMEERKTKFNRLMSDVCEDHDLKWGEDF